MSARHVGPFTCMLAKEPFRHIGDRETTGVARSVQTSIALEDKFQLGVFIQSTFATLAAITGLLDAAEGPRPQSITYLR